MMSWQVKRLPISSFQANCYWLENGSQAWLIDPSAWPEKKPHSEAVLQGIIASHGHMDHVCSADDWRQKNKVPLYIHQDDAYMLADSMANASALFGSPMKWQKAEGELIDQDEIKFEDGATLTVIHTPGHTQGSICLLLTDKNQEEIALFTGDTIFADSVGRTDLVGGSSTSLEKSLLLIKSLHNNKNSSMQIYPGHGAPISFGELCRTHPYL